MAILYLRQASRRAARLACQIAMSLRCNRVRREAGTDRAPSCAGLAISAEAAKASQIS